MIIAHSNEVLLEIALDVENRATLVLHVRFRRSDASVFVEKIEVMTDDGSFQGPVMKPLDLTLFASYRDKIVYGCEKLLERESGSRLDRFYDFYTDRRPERVGVVFCLYWDECRDCRCR